MCFSPQRRAIFRHRNFKKCSETDVFCTLSLQNVLFTTAACNFWFIRWPPDSAPAALTGLLFDWPDTRIIEKTQHFATSLTFGAYVSSFFWLSRYCIFFLPTWLPVSSAFQLSILSEVCYLNFLRLYDYAHKMSSINCLSCASIHCITFWDPWRRQSSIFCYIHSWRLGTNHLKSWTYHVGIQKSIICLFDSVWV